MFRDHIMNICGVIDMGITNDTQTDKISETKSVGLAALMGGMTLVPMVPISNFGWDR